MTEDRRSRYVGKINPWEATERELEAMSVVVRFLADNPTQNGKVVSWFPVEIAEATKLDVGVTKNALELAVKEGSVIRGIFKKGKRKIAAYKVVHEGVTPVERIREPKGRTENETAGWKKHG